MHAREPASPISRYIWETRYRQSHADGSLEHSLYDSWRRVANAVAAVESDAQEYWADRYLQLLTDFRFLPGGRILAGAGTSLNVTLFNCFVMGTIEDDMESIFDSLKEGALTMQAGGGIGYDFSTLRPRGCKALSTGRIASGPVSFMQVWNSMCATVLSTGSRRGAMIGSLRCDHPDLEAFIDAKRQPHHLEHFNLSVQITDEFMWAVQEDKPWPLVFPAQALGDGVTGELVERTWSGSAERVTCRVLKYRPARELWEAILAAAYETAEPGVLFIDRINEDNNLAYRESISTTNPCGEIPLPAYGACNLGSINLTRFVDFPFSASARLNLTAIERVATTATRFLDNVIDCSKFPIVKQAEQALGTRRIGLGITGLADALIMLGLDYNSAAARSQAEQVMRCISHSAYRASIHLARERAPFPFLRRDAYLRGGFASRLPADIRQDITDHGIRNSHLTAIAPCGTISLLADNISSGIEPVHDLRQRRRIVDSDGHYKSFELEDHAYRLWRESNPNCDELPDYFKTSNEVSADSQLLMQTVLQRQVDNAISKTVNVSAQFGFEAFRHIYQFAWQSGLKGCTAYRPTALRGEVLSLAHAATEQEAHCCTPNRETD